MTLGFRILQRRRAVAVEDARRFLDIPVANVSDCMSRMSAGGADLALLNSAPTTRMAGPALTVRTRPGDNLVIHKALTMIEPGDILVIDAGGDLTNAVMGEIMVTAGMARGLAGLVVHGAVRDAAFLRAGSLPVFARGITHRGPYRDGPGEVNVPVCIGGMVISPGDLVLGDADGVLAIPINDVEDVFEAALKRSDFEAAALQKIASGQRDDSWIDTQLAARGYVPAETSAPEHGQ